MHLITWQSFNIINSMPKYIVIILINFFVVNSLYADQFKDVQQYINVHEYALALEKLKSISPKNKKDLARQSFFIGEIYYALGKVSKAEEFFSDANMKSPDNGEYASGYAKAKMSLGKLSDAQEIAQSVIDEDFNVIQAHIVLATIDERLGKVNESKERFEELINLQPQSEIMHVAYADFLDQRVNSWDAINLLNKYIKRYPNSPTALDHLGTIYSYVDDDANALKFKSKASKLYKERGQIILSESIEKWIKDYQVKSIPAEKYEDEQVIAENKEVQLQKPSLKFQNPNLVDPWPIGEGEYAYTGSGFITSSGSQVVTNRHVIEDAKRLYVRNGYGELKSAKVLKLSDEDDIAILSLDSSFNSEISLSIPANYPVKPGQDAYVIGYPLADILGENKPSITQGIISKSTGMFDDPGTFQITAKLNQGNSGGPIFSREGNILGIAVAKIDKTLMLQEEGMIPEDVNFGIPVSRIDLLTGNSSNEIFTKDLELELLYESVLPSVVMILNIVNVQN